MIGNTADSNVRYSRDKPNDCKFCYYWLGRKEGCLMDERAYLIREEVPAENSRRNGCPYGKYSPYIRQPAKSAKQRFSAVQDG